MLGHLHARIAGLRAQRGNRAELDPLGHPGKRHGRYPGSVGRGGAALCVIVFTKLLIYRGKDVNQETQNSRSRD